ncbi:hypothetical protein [Fluviispira sanaruensis]|uniref:Uncharacterized protein n=1 Tax=Fluviispira sanaruensis TaxID=2493639 RepID=A0A4P2VQU9_FLUSA|nr:hypothetical protein [Fluviispira sanaruensis]BBH54489.1 hypothetical protein JCM31447_29600 [Fluviispira sanaruensis]
MFTRATKKFGVWKEERESSKIFYLVTSRHFFFSLAIAAFVSWIIFLITIKVRQEFYVMESTTRTFTKFKNLKKINPGFYFTERRSALSILLILDKESGFKIFFDTGKSFYLPKQANEFLMYLEERRQNIMLTSMLMRIEDRSISRVKIWSDNNVSFKDIRYIMKLFSQYGYDDFDFVVER